MNAELVTSDAAWASSSTSSLTVRFAADCAGIAMLMWYTIYTDLRPQYDCGLLTPTAVRQPTYDTWKCLPGC